jgi:phospholipid/cholesterol/gamma-HCH transport system permease protein
VPIGGVNHGVFMNGLLSEITLMDLWVGMGKCTIFGGAVGLIAGYLGLRTSGGAEGVGRAANNTVVTTILLILIADYALGVLFLKLGI